MTLRVMWLFLTVPQVGVQCMNVSVAIPNDAASWSVVCECVSVSS